MYTIKYNLQRRLVIGRDRLIEGAVVEVFAYTESVVEVSRDLPVQLRQPNLRPVGKLFVCDHFFLVHRIMLQYLEIQNGQKFQKPVMLHLFQKSVLWLIGDLEGLFFHLEML